MNIDIKYYVADFEHRGRPAICWTDGTDDDHVMIFNGIQIRCVLLEDDNTWWVIAADEDHDDEFNDLGPYPTVVEALTMLKLLGSKNEMED